MDFTTGELDQTGEPAPDAAPRAESSPARAPLQTVTVVAPLLALAACGEGGVTTGPIASPPPTPAPTATLSDAQASRFLGQATMGASRVGINALVSRGIDGWLTDQFATSRTIAHWDWLVGAGYADASFMNSQAGFDITMWRQLITDPAQLRQRVGMALLDMLVVGIDGVNLNYVQFAMASYVDVLLDNAFGNFRDIMDKITTNAAMSSYLTFLDNRKASATTGAQPDENYARELMQLFTIGLYKLNMDGSLVGGVATETYVQADVTGLARIFTGLTLAAGVKPDRYRLPLVMNAAINETGSSTFLGTTVSGGGLAAIKTALDTIFAHPNVPPFVSKQLIQRLVTSNPTPAYVGRVSAVFANNGSGVRGDMRAVIRAILTDTEARGDTSLGITTTGKLREPVMRLTGWARAFNATSPAGTWPIGDTSSQSTRLGQSMGRAPSVFNFFRPEYTPPNTGLSTAGLVGPEFQITNEQSVVGYVNYINGLVNTGSGDVKADYTDMLTLSADSALLVGECNVVLAAGQLSAATVTAIRAAVDSVANSGTNGPTNRVKIAILLTLASPDFLMVK